MGGALFLGGWDHISQALASEDRTSAGQQHAPDLALRFSNRERVGGCNIKKSTYIFIMVVVVNARKQVVILVVLITKARAFGAFVEHYIRPILQGSDQR